MLHLYSFVKPLLPIGISNLLESNPRPFHALVSQKIGLQEREQLYPAHFKQLEDRSTFRKSWYEEYESSFFHAVYFE